MEDRYKEIIKIINETALPLCVEDTVEDIWLYCKQLEKENKELKEELDKANYNLMEGQELIAHLEKENKKLKEQLEEKDMEHELDLIGKEEYIKVAMGEIIEYYYTANENCVPRSKIEDKIKELEESIVILKNIIDLNKEVYTNNEMINTCIDLLKSILEE